MKINIQVNKNLRIRAFYLFFIISAIQAGVGVLNAPRDVFLVAGRDAWFSIIIALIYLIIIVAVMFVILKQYESADIFGIQVDIFGKVFGKILGTIYIIYFIGGLLSVLTTYTLAIQIFIYPSLPAFFIGILIMSLVVYAVLGGIRVIVGVVFIFGILTPWIFFLLYDPITRMDFLHFRPMFHTPVTDLLKGARTSAYNFLGVEFLFVIYPFIENKRKAKLPVYLSVTTSALIVLVTTIISIGYYSLHDFKKMDWPVLRLFKSVSLPFLERFDYIVIVQWMMVVIPSIVLLMWAITHGTKRLYKIPQKVTLYIMAILLIISNSLLKYSYQIAKVTQLISKIGFWIVFVYPFFLLPLVLIKKKWQKYKGSVEK